jgi:hypothetical protein
MLHSNNGLDEHLSPAAIAALLGQAHGRACYAAAATGNTAVQQQLPVTVIPVRPCSTGKFYARKVIILTQI